MMPSQFSVNFILNLYFAASLWITSTFSFGLFDNCRSALAILRWSVCLQENGELLFGVQLFVAEDFLPFGWELSFWHLLVFVFIVDLFLSFSYSLYFLCFTGSFLKFVLRFLFLIFSGLSKSLDFCFNFSFWSLHFWALVRPEYLLFQGLP